MDSRLSDATSLFVADLRATGAHAWFPRLAYQMPLEYIESNYADGFLDPRWSGLVYYVADELQDWVIHRLWMDVQQPTNWPVCPRHPTTHPLKPIEREDQAVWICPADGELIAAIGSSPSAAWLYRGRPAAG